MVGVTAVAACRVAHDRYMWRTYETAETISHAALYLGLALVAVWALAAIR